MLFNNYIIKDYTDYVQTRERNIKFVSFFHMWHSQQSNVIV